MALVLVGELLALALVVADHGLFGFSWTYFGMMSFLVQWIVLSSAACLCPLRTWFKRQHSVVAGMVSYGIVLLLTAFFTCLGQYVQNGGAEIETNALLSNLVLAAIFSGIVLRYFYLQQQLQNQQKAELQSRVQALQSRIRPHFLFNSMNSIASLIDIEPETAEQMVVDLAALFRASLAQSSLVPMAEELHLCRRFVAIEQLRLGKRLSVEWRIKNDLESETVPSLLIQPLIENAIYHGVQPLKGGGLVVVEVGIVGENVEIIVSNPVEVQVVNEHTGNGIALDNIQHRLNAYFGVKAHLSIQRKQNEFKVTVRYPVVKSR